MSKATGMMSERRSGNGMSEVTSVMSEGLTAWDLRNNVVTLKEGSNFLPRQPADKDNWPEETEC